MLSKDLQGLYEAYKNVYEKDDLITDELVEEVIVELFDECIEEGYTIDEAAVAIEEAATEYFDEAKITYGSDTESPEQRRARAQSKVGEKRSAARKAAVKGAVERVKTTAQGAKAAAGIAGSIAKDEARRAGRAAKQAVVGAVQKKKEEVKKGVKGLLGKGLRAAAGAAGSVAQKARKVGAAAGSAAARLGEEFDSFDVVLEFLQAEGYAETLEEAEWMMANLIDEEAIDIILGEEQLDEVLDTPEKANEYARKNVRSMVGAFAKGVANKDISQLKTIEKRKRGAELGKRKAERKAAEEQNESFELWVNELVEEGYDLSDYTWDEMYEIYESEGSYGQTPKARQAMGKLAIARREKPASEYSQKGEKTKKVKSIEKHTQRIDNGPDVGNRGKKSTKPRYSGMLGKSGRGKLDQDSRDYARDSAVEYTAGGNKPGPGTVTKNPKKLRKQKAMGEIAKEAFESWLDEAMSNYEKNRKRAAQRAAARNAARDQGKTGAVPGVGYVTPRRERETWTDESGKTRHAKGL